MLKDNDLKIKNKKYMKDNLTQEPAYTLFEILIWSSPFNNHTVILLLKFDLH